MTPNEQKTIKNIYFFIILNDVVTCGCGCGWGCGLSVAAAVAVAVPGDVAQTVAT